MLVAVALLEQEAARAAKQAPRATEHRSERPTGAGETAAEDRGADRAAAFARACLKLNDARVRLGLAPRSPALIWAEAAAEDTAAAAASDRAWAAVFARSLDQTAAVAAAWEASDLALRAMGADPAGPASDAALRSIKRVGETATLAVRTARRERVMPTPHFDKLHRAVSDAEELIDGAERGLLADHLAAAVARHAAAAARLVKARKTDADRLAARAEEAEAVAQEDAAKAASLAEEARAMGLAVGPDGEATGPVTEGRPGPTGAAASA